MKVIKKCTLLAMLTLLMAGIIGCGQKETQQEAEEKPAPVSAESSVNEDDGVYLSTIEKTERSYDGSYVRFMCQKDGKSYYLVSVYNEAEQMSKYYIRVIDSDSGERIGEDAEVSFETEGAFINCLAVAGDDYIAVGGSYTENSQVYYIARFSHDGNIKAEKCLSDILDLPQDTYLYNGMTSDGVNTYIPFTDKLVVFDEQLNYKKTLSNESYVNFCVGGDGILYFTAGYDGEVSTYNPKTDKLTEKVFSTASSSNFYVGGENELLIATGSSLKSYDIKSGNITKLFDFLDVNINTQMFETIFRSKNGDIHILFNEFEKSTEEFEDETVEVNIAVPYKAVVKRYEPGSVPEIAEIKLACFYANPEIKTAVNEFNMAHSDIRAKIKCYSDDYPDYQAMTEAFDRDLLNGEKYDVIMNSYQDLNKYVEKGLLENLMDYISMDSSFDVSEFYENVLFARKDGDKLYSITSTATIDGFIGLSDVFGDKEKLSIYDIANARAKFPDIQFIPNYDRDVIFLSILLNGDYRAYLGGKEGEYNFETDEFRKLCEVSATFKRMQDDVVYLQDGYDGFADGTTVIGRENYFGTEAYLMGRTAGKNVKAYGGPSIDGNGHILYVSEGFSISSLSTHKEEAWELIKSLLMTMPDYPNGFKAYKKAFKADVDGMLTRAKNGTEVYINDRKYVLFMEEEDAAILEKMVKNATVTKRMDDTVWNIVYEEIQPYFAKQKSLDDVIKVIQSRVNLYLAEKE